MSIALEIILKITKIYEERIYWGVSSDLVIVDVLLFTSLQNWIHIFVFKILT